MGSRTSVSLSGRSSSKPKIWLQRAQFRERVGDAEGALTAYGRALASSDEGRDQKAFLRRAQLLKRLNRDREALLDYTSAIGIGDREAPRGTDWRSLMAEAHRDRAILYQKQGLSAEATQERLASRRVLHSTRLGYRDQLAAWSRQRDQNPNSLSADHYGWMSEQRYQQGDRRQACLDARLGARLGHPQLQRWLQSPTGLQWCRSQPTP